MKISYHSCDKCIGSPLAQVRTYVEAVIGNLVAILIIDFNKYECPHKFKDWLVLRQYRRWHLEYTSYGNYCIVILKK